MLKVTRSEEPSLFAVQPGKGSSQSRFAGRAVEAVNIDSQVKNELI